MNHYNTINTLSLILFWTIEMDCTILVVICILSLVTTGDEEKNIRIQKTGIIFHYRTLNKNMENVSIL